MSIVTRTTAKSYLETGDVPTEGQFSNIMDSIPFAEDNVYTALSGTTWDGTPKTKTLTGNLSLTLSTTRRAGKLKVKQDGTGGRTLSIDSISIPISSGINDVSIVFFDYDDVAAEYDFFVDTSHAGNVSGGGGDVTAPTVISAEPSDTTHIEVIFSESVTVTTAGWSFKKNGSNLAITSVSGAGTTWSFLVATMASGDTLSMSYNSGTGATVDGSSNELVTFTDVVITNTLTGGWIDIDYPTQTHLTEASDVWTGTNVGDADNTGLSNKYLPSGVSGRYAMRADSRIAYLGLKTANAQPNGGASASTDTDVAIYLDAGHAYYQKEGAGSAVLRLLGVTLSGTDWICLFRNGATGAIKIQYSTDNKATWTDSGDTPTATFNSTANLYLVTKMYQTTGTNLSHPMAEGAV